MGRITAVDAPWYRLSASIPLLSAGSASYRCFMVQVFLEKTMKRLHATLLLCSAVLVTGSLAAEPAHAGPACSTSYTVARGDTLASIARTAYGDVNLWPYIYGYKRNAKVIGANPSAMSPGIDLDLPPCPVIEPAAASPAIDKLAAWADDLIEVVTASDYAPWTDQRWENGGMLTEIVEAVLDRSIGSDDHAIDWVNDRAAHIDPLLSGRKYDMGFPWFKPNCAAPDSLSEADAKRCAFHFSEPLFDMTIALYQRSDDARLLADDEALHGMRFCRPSGYVTFDLVERGLIPGDTIELVQPQSVAECFHKLVDGDVDFVALNAFTGESTIERFGYDDVVSTSERLGHTLGLRLIIPRDHPRGEDLLQSFNAGLQDLRATGGYDEIVGRHLAIFHGRNG